MTLSVPRPVVLNAGVAAHLASLPTRASRPRIEGLLPFDFISSLSSGEGPRSRRYGRTAALRLLVQPCDEDDNDYYYFSPFPSNGALME
jgi:hypothetical protein